MSGLYHFCWFYECTQLFYMHSFSNWAVTQDYNSSFHLFCWTKNSFGGLISWVWCNVIAIIAGIRVKLKKNRAESWSLYDNYSNDIMIKSFSLCFYMHTKKINAKHRYLELWWSDHKTHSWFNMQRLIMHFRVRFFMSKYLNTF